MGILDSKKATLFCFVGGMLFGIAWIVMFNALAYRPIPNNGGIFFIPPIMMTCSLIMLNLIDWNRMYSPDGTDAKAWIFSMFVLIFASVFCSIYFAFHPPYKGTSSMYLVNSNMIGTFLLFTSSVILRIGRNVIQSEYGHSELI